MSERPINTLHLFRGLCRLETSNVRAAIWGLARDPDRLAAYLGSQLQDPDALQDTQELSLSSFSPRTSNILCLAGQAAAEESSPRIEDRHILLGLLRDGGGFTADQLRKLDLDPARLGELLARHPLFDAAGHLRMERLDDTVRSAIDLGQEHARRTRFSCLTVSHLFMALTSIENSLTQQAIRHSPRRLDPRRVWEAIRHTLELETPQRDEIALIQGAFTRRLQGILRLAWRAAHDQGADQITERHLLLGFIDAEGGRTARVLADYGIDLRVVLDPDFGGTRPTRIQEDAGGAVAVAPPPKAPRPREPRQDQGPGKEPATDSSGTLFDETGHLDRARFTRGRRLAF